MPRPTMISAQISNWHFRTQHEVWGYIQNDTRECPMLDGDHVEIKLISSVTEFANDYLIRTPFGNCFQLLKAQEEVSKKETNIKWLNMWIKSPSGHS